MKWLFRSKDAESVDRGTEPARQDARPSPRPSPILRLQRLVGNRVLQRLATGRARRAAAQPPAGPGRPLDGGTRDYMESRFGHDLSEVRVHADVESATSAASLDARAYTSGRDIYFGHSEYAPGTTEGRRLLAHELAHVLQQTGAGTPAGTGARVVPAHDPSEMEAEAAARKVTEAGADVAPVDPGHLRSATGIQRVTLTAKDYDGLAEQLHDAMYRFGTDEEAIFVALQKLEKDAAAITKLKDVYKKKYAADLEADIRSEMSGSELRFALELLGIASKKPEERVAAGPPSTAAEYESVAAQLHAAMKGPGTNEEEIYAALMPFKRDAAKLTTLKSTYKTKHSGGLYGKSLEDDIKQEMSSDELAYALYLLNAPPPATPSAPTTVVAAGTEQHTGKVPGGEVSVRTGVSYDSYTGGFSVGYKGGLAPESRWLQFFWEEALATQADKSVKRIAGSYTYATGSAELTTDPSAPKYKVDSASSTSPFYEAGFTHVRGAAATTIYDRPGAITSYIHKAFDAGATKVVDRLYFETFLVRDYKTIYRVGVVVEWVYTSKTSVTRTTSSTGGGEVKALPAGMRKQLIKEFPKFDYIQ